MRRALLGLISVALIAVSLLGFSRFGTNHVGSIALFRSGLVLGALWLALPQLLQTPPWAIVGTLVGLVLVAVQPKLLIFLFALMAAYGVFQWLYRKFFQSPGPARRVARRPARPPRQE